ncbi:hypothetical protein RB614_14925 [Phytohabitans sp. ZYX-F-186]|uniref:Adhesin domain-containing protein n=1 Tax=Phytohabitans maris TaxID=3071409 RepID=A0ABU0ZHP3_9ACTN|nr:hypothetical protein [Phytohabitans sp. ZYX-F-186]MDQ7905810.1 hypothetical protein [Phytohabitans sp. ZYX-F-186]
MTAQPGERTVSWLDEDDPKRGSVPFVPVESVIELTPAAEEPPPAKKSRREKAPKPPKPPKPPRGRLWRRGKATQEKPPRDDPPRDVTPRAGDRPAPAGDDWLTTLRGPAPRQEWAASRDTKPRDGGLAALPEEAPRNTGPHPAWAAAPEGALDDEDWASTPPVPPPPPREAPREDWFTPREAPGGDGAPNGEADRPEWDEPPQRGGDWAAAPTPEWDQPREPAAGPDRDAASADRGTPATGPDWDAPAAADRGAFAAETPQRPDWVATPDWDTPRETPAGPAWDAAPPPDGRPGWDTNPDQPDHGWDTASEQADPRNGWDTAPEQPDPRDGWDGRPEQADREGPGQADRRTGWDSEPEQIDRRTGWNGGPEPTDRGRGWDSEPEPADPRNGRNSGPDQSDRRTGWDEPGSRKGWDDEPESRDGWAGGGERRVSTGNEPDDPGGWGGGSDRRVSTGNEPDDRDGWGGGGERRVSTGNEPDDPGGWGGGGERRVGTGDGGERKARPDWVTSPVPAGAPAAAPDGGWADAEPSDNPVPEAWPAPLDITPDDDLDEPPAKRRRGPQPRPRPSGPPTGGRTGGRPSGRGRRRKPLMVLAIALTAAVAASAVVAAGTIYRLVFDGGTQGSHTIAAPLGGRTKGELQLASGAETVTVSGADLGDNLFQVTTPDSDDAIPRATIQGDRTTVRLTSNRGEGASAVEIRLNSRVTWRLVFTTGAKTQTVDMSGGRLSGLEMAGGATRLELTLPKPDATVPIQLRGGLNELLLHAPRGVLTRVKIGKGVTNLTLDRLNRSKVAPGTTFTPNGWAQAKAGYDVDAAEGIGTVKLDRR